MIGCLSLRTSRTYSICRMPFFFARYIQGGRGRRVVYISFCWNAKYFNLPEWEGFQRAPVWGDWHYHMPPAYGKGPLLFSYANKFCEMKVQNFFGSANRNSLCYSWPVGRQYASRKESRSEEGTAKVQSRPLGKGGGLFYSRPEYEGDNNDALHWFYRRLGRRGASFIFMSRLPKTYQKHVS